MEIDNKKILLKSRRIKQNNFLTLSYSNIQKRYKTDI